MLPLRNGLLLTRMSRLLQDKFQILATFLQDQGNPCRLRCHQHLMVEIVPAHLEDQPAADLSLESESARPNDQDRLAAWSSSLSCSARGLQQVQARGEVDPVVLSTKKLDSHLASQES